MPEDPGYATDPSPLLEAARLTVTGMRFWKMNAWMLTCPFPSAIPIGIRNMLATAQQKGPVSREQQIVSEPGGDCLSASVAISQDNGADRSDGMAMHDSIGQVQEQEG